MKKVLISNYLLVLKIQGLMFQLNLFVNNLSDFQKMQKNQEVKMYNLVFLISMMMTLKTAHSQNPQLLPFWLE